MAHCYRFAIVRLAPDETRDERINVGAIVATDQGLDVRTSRRLERARALSAALDVEALRQLILNLREVDDHLRESGMTVAQRLETLSNFGPLRLSSPGTFAAENASDYEARIDTILKAMVEPEPATARVREKRSRLLTQIKTVFRKERVLATKDEDIQSHRIVSSFELDDGLVADFVLRNGAMHVVETVDASGHDDSLRKAISEIALAALVLERARMRVGEDGMQARLVYAASAGLERAATPSLETAQHQGAILTNWSSGDDRLKFVQDLSSLATPVPKKSRNKAARFAIAGKDQGFHFH